MTSGPYQCDLAEFYLTGAMGDTNHIHMNFVEQSLSIIRSEERTTYRVYIDNEANMTVSTESVDTAVNVRMATVRQAVHPGPESPGTFFSELSEEVPSFSILSSQYRF